MIDVGKPYPFAPLAPTQSRAEEVSKRIASEIASGRLPAGTRLPTEFELVSSLGVSRSVVREAVASLRADGLVVTRQGSGTFVASDASRVPFRVNPDDVKSISDVIHIMEMRLAIEVAAAAFAAERGPADGLVRLKEALHAIDMAIGRGESAVHEDFAFHRAIAQASGNPMFDAFLTFLGHHVIPRQHARAENTSQDQRAAYLAKIQREHRTIAEAILARDSTAARRAMLRHLANSLERQRKFARSSVRDKATDRGRRR
jgi:GntR family transcriptional regulator, transcriptional repressor for pyruvate dehydrogenase complex